MGVVSSVYSTTNLWQLFRTLQPICSSFSQWVPFPACSTFSQIQKSQTKVFSENDALKMIDLGIQNWRQNFSEKKML